MNLWHFPNIILLSLAASNALAATAQYRAEFVATWSSQTHPNAYPSGAHFSPLIGAVHNSQVSFWSPGGTTSNGIEEMAETGGRTMLQAEMQSAITAGTAASLILGSPTVLSSPGSISPPNFEVSTEYPLVTLVTMVAPSPDWFVGIHDLDLREGNGWKNSVTIELFPYDAGSDSGPDFRSPDANVSPRQNITRLGAPFTAGDPPLGTFTLTLVPEPTSASLISLAAIWGVFSLRRSRKFKASRWRVQTRQ